MRSIVHLLPAFAVCALLTSCQNSQNSQKSGDPYVSNYGSDGGYHPYPGQPGTVQSGGSYSPVPAAPSTPAYSKPPAPTPPPSDPYAFSPPSTPASAPASTAPRKTTASSSSTKPKPKAPAKKSSSSYKVVSGDTLYGIARKRGSTVAKIKAANNLTSDLIRPGQALKIP
ncbi:MAG: LysM peptidoglycan-binding domain-containing protein [Prosthecobacter sp.]|nr:LysM peptidoglycan-binding domain-containing protein [Prosthecobacter sp.]